MQKAVMNFTYAKESIKAVCNMHADLDQDKST